MLLSLGAGAVALWRSQQARDKALQVFDTAKDRFQDVSASLPIGGESSQTTGSDQPQRSGQATTTMLSQTNPDAGVSMSHDGGAVSTPAQDSSSYTTPSSASGDARPVDYSLPDAASQSSDTARSREAATAQARDEMSSESSEERDGSLADIPADSLVEQSNATASELVESSHQPDSMEVSESAEQTHMSEDVVAAQRPEEPVAATPPQPASADNASTFRPADDPDAGQLDADGEDRTITDRVRTRLGQELEHAEWGHVNINTQAFGVVYLRGYVESDELRSRIEQIARDTEGVESVVNELNVEQQGNE